MTKYKIESKNKEFNEGEQTESDTETVIEAA